MKQIALVSLETDTGVVRRYLRAEGNKAELTSFDFFNNWPTARRREDEVFGIIQAFRRGSLTPEPPFEPEPSAAAGAA